MSKTRGPSIHGVLDYRSFLGKPAPLDPILKLEKYPTDALIVLLAKANAIIFQGSHDRSNVDNEIFRLVFNRLDRRIYDYVKDVRTNYTRGVEAIFTAPPIVGLMAKLIEKYRPVKENDAISDAGLSVIMMELFEAILAVNDSYYNSAKGNMLTRTDIWKLGLLQQDFARGISNMFGVIPIKIFMFFRFISERFGETVLQEFANSFGVASAYNFYFVFLETVVNSYRAYEADGQPRYVLMDETLQKVITPFVIDTVSTRQVPFSGESFVLMNQPFFRIAGGIVVLDFSFFSHLTDISLIYHFYQSTSLKRIHGIKNYNEYMGMIGKQFIEEYLTLQLIQHLFHHRHDRIFTENDNPDYPDVLILQNKRDVFVIEVKSSKVHAKVLGETDTDGFRDFLEQSFASEKKGPGEKNKGIHQLKKQIQALKENGRGYRIFPVIIYTEVSLDMPGVNSFLDEKFDQIIDEERASFKKIHPLTLINLHFFIKYFPSLKKERYFLRDKIVEYHRRKKQQLKEGLRKENPYIYLMAEYSFLQLMEQTYPPGDPRDYFKQVAEDLGFKEEGQVAKNAGTS
jgi:hypothetical protein